MQLPRRISKLILNVDTPVSPMMSIPQENIHHLVVERRLIDTNEIHILACQFPRVIYLELLFPFEKLSFLRCIQTLFCLADNTEKRSFWSEMTYFRTILTDEQSFST
ncbi:unnamed protein product [Rotaria sp. Silwood1]|nr:unnamed protein product [Rotaria sp. Silwood1]CAF3614562.1 unnamed protein product [Rotaria sp. Silwood1]CAF3628232.1 unnamed protein product [Rotaria sp. Silwood1]CAF3632831.1 unnamed protein product [Rotaria sp. Silwood1]CAF3665298.1 unnamed protein product [Rotaria sp. Silwood1]